MAQKYSKDSFDRFGDDFCELLLYYLSIKDKFLYECVSNQWKRLIYNKQKNLKITRNYFFRDYIPQLIDANRRRHEISYDLNLKHLKSLLKKCGFINAIEISDDLETINGKVLDVIRDSGIHLKAFICLAEVKSLTQKQLNSFGLKFSQSLTQFRIEGISYAKMKKLFLSISFTHLENLYFEDEVKEDVFKQLNEHSLNKLREIKFPFRGFDGLRVLSNNYCNRIKKIDIVLDTENAVLLRDGLNKALIQLSELKNLEYFNIRIFTENTVITAIDKGLKMIAKNCKKIKRLDFLMDCIVIKGKLFEIFCLFRELEFCEISIEFNEEMTDYGSIACFSECKNLRFLNLYLYNLCDDHYKDIDLHIPKLRSFHIKSKTGISDITLGFLKKCINLNVFEVHTWDDLQSMVNITDSAVCNLIDSCPKIRIILLFSKSEGITPLSVIELMNKANRYPEVQHYFVCAFREQTIFSFKNNSDWNSISPPVLFPENLRVVKLPQRKDLFGYVYKSINSTQTEYFLMQNIIRIR